MFWTVELTKFSMEQMDQIDLEKDRFSFRIVARLSSGTEFSHDTEMVPYDALNAVAEDMTKAKKLMDTLLTGESKEGLVTVGKWNLRGKDIEAYSITLMWHQHMEEIP